MGPQAKSVIFRILYISTLIMLLSGCNPSKHLPENKYLLNKTRIEVEDPGVNKEQLKSYLRQKPNRRILGFYRFHLNVYQFANKRKPSKFNNWLKNTIGEPPVVYDATLTQSTEKQFELYLQNMGYFNARVDHVTEFRKKKAEVTYHVQANTPYHIRNIYYDIKDPHLESFIFSDTASSLISRGQRYNTEIFQQERERITRSLKNKGFFSFSKEFISYQVDSALNSHQVDLYMLVHNPGGAQPQADRQSLRHKRYIIDNIYIYPDHSPFSPETTFSDSTYFHAEEENTYVFLHNNPLRIRGKALVQNILLSRGDFFSVRDMEQTYNYLAGLNNFRFINIKFTETDSPETGTLSDTIGFLNANIQLARSPSNSYTIEAEGINSSGNLGVAGNFLFQNRNLFRGAEIFNLRLKTALEVTDETSPNETVQRFPFNTVELGGEVSINFPKLLFPLPMEYLSKNARPKSTILTGINYRQRPDYTRYVFNVSYGFEWSQNPRKRHVLHPLEISTIKIFNDSILQANIPESNPLLLSRFKNHLITATNYSYTYNSQTLGSKGNFMFFRGNIESSGNFLNLITKAFNTSKDQQGQTTILNIPFAQYLKGDAEFRHYWVSGNRSSLVFRAIAGLGVPYGNAGVLPFIKSYYAGGANGLRAWKIYSLGPGGYQDTGDSRFDKYGDIKLEANIEYRFPIYSFWHGAVFADAGNVWFIEENPEFPDGSFEANRFYKEIALGTGIGLRMDFDFFVVRVDMGVPLKEPGNPEGERWIKNWPSLRKFNLNLGIGYPF